MAGIESLTPSLGKCLVSMNSKDPTALLSDSFLAGYLMKPLAIGDLILR